MYICAAILPFAYIVGLLFTLKTHSHIIHAKVPDQDEEDEGTLFIT
jgi:Ca2+/H+ antiporter